MKVWLAVAVAVGLSACIPVRGTGEVWMSDEAIEAKDNATCSSFGAARGTQAYTACRLQLRSDRSAEDRIRRYL